MQKLFDVKIKEIDDKETSLEDSFHFQQTSFWGEFKAHHGWTHKCFEIEWSFLGDEDNFPKNKKDTVSVLFRTFAQFFSIAYIPLYPTLPFDKQSTEGEGDEWASKQTLEFASLLEGIAVSLKRFLPKNTLCVRFDPAVDFSTPEMRDEFNYGVALVSFADRLKVIKNSVDIQPPDTTIVDLTNTEEEILSAMKGKWRYNIHLAERKGVCIEKVDRNCIDLSTKIDDFYKLYRITSERDGISIHPKRYYQDLMERSASQKDAPLVTLYIARHGEDCLGAIITLFTKKEGVYLYGASSNVKRNFMPNFLLQWTAMKDAKEYGSSFYDLYGMPPTDDENHPMHGLYLFKTGFGGKNVHRVGSYDVRLSALYGLCTKLESFRAWWHKKFLKKIRGR